MASYGLTNVEDVGIPIQNNQKTINGLERERGIKLMRKGERQRERVKKEKLIPPPFVQSWNAHCFCYSEKRLHREIQVNIYVYIDTNTLALPPGTTPH